MRRNHASFILGKYVNPKCTKKGCYGLRGWTDYNETTQRYSICPCVINNIAYARSVRIRKWLSMIVVRYFKYQIRLAKEAGAGIVFPFRMKIRGITGSKAIKQLQRVGEPFNSEDPDA